MMSFASLAINPRMSLAHHARCFRQYAWCQNFPRTLLTPPRYAANGYKAFFPNNGVAVQMIRDIPYAIATLLTYEMLLEHWVQKVKDAPRWRNMVAGATAGGVGSIVSNPMDVIKTRIQMDPDLYESIAMCARKTAEGEGMKAFMRGAAPRLMHKIPANGLFFMFYEVFRTILGVVDKDTFAPSK